MSGSFVGTPMKVTLERPEEGTRVAPGKAWTKICVSFSMAAKGTEPAKVRTKLVMDEDQRPDSKVSGDFAALNPARICWVIGRGSRHPLFSTCTLFLRRIVISV